MAAMRSVKGCMMSENRLSEMRKLFILCNAFGSDSPCFPIVPGCLRGLGVGQLPQKPHGEIQWANGLTEHATRGAEMVTPPFPSPGYINQPVKLLRNKCQIKTNQSTETCIHLDLKIYISDCLCFPPVITGPTRLHDHFTAAASPFKSPRPPSNPIHTHKPPTHQSKCSSKEPHNACSPPCDHMSLAE